MKNFFDKTDSELKEDVVEELNFDPSVNADAIEVTANDGIVTLLGSVPYYFQKATADAAAQRVHGVRAVADELEVNLSRAENDQQIAKKALDMFRWTVSIPNNIQLKVEKGWVTLSGQAQWDFQRKATQHAVSQLEGVCGVTNNIELKSVVPGLDVKESIEASLKRSAINDSKQIKVSTDGSGHVTLTGHCRSLSELNDATYAAWMAPRVTDVANDIQLTTLNL